MKSRSIFIGIVLILSGIFAQAQEATALVTQARTLYRQRYDAQGRYINNPQLQAQFIANQNAIIKKIKTAGYAKRTAVVTNDFMEDLVVTISLVQETNGLFAGLLVERNKYDNKSEEEALRLYDLPLLLKGMSVLNYNGVSMVGVSSQQITAQQGGEINIRYPTDFKKKTFGVAKFAVLKTTVGDFSFFTPVERKSFNRVELDVWFNLFAQNFGIKSVSFR